MQAFLTELVSNFQFELTPDVARVCNAVACGDLSQKITVPVHGDVMVQLKEVINGMVRV